MKLLEKSVLKGLVTEFTWGSTEPYTAQEYGLLNFFFNPVDPTDDFFISRIGPIVPLWVLVVHFRQIRDTSKSIVAATGIDIDEQTVL